MADADAPQAQRPHHPAQLDDDELMRECDLARGRTSGPGGQHRNRVATQVSLVHRPTGISAQAGERRTPEVNRRVAVRRLRLALATEHRMPVPDGEIRSDLWRQRCRGSKISCNTQHRDYPSLLAEAMDVLAASGCDPKRAALRLCCSTSQLIKLIKEHPPALEVVNAHRLGRGQHALK